MKFYKLAVAMSVAALSGCATPPDWLANYYDSKDPCQAAQVQRTGTMPSWCLAPKPAARIQTSTGATIGYIRK